MPRVTAITAALSAAFLPASARAETPPGDPEAMQQRLDQLESLVGELRGELAAERTARQQMESTAVIRPVSDGKSLKFQSPNNDYSFQMGGRIEMDAAHYNADRQNLGDGTDARRARLYAQGTMYRDWDWKFEYEFADNSTTSTNSKGITDAYLRYTGFAPVLVTAGNFKQPFGLEQVRRAI